VRHSTNTIGALAAALALCALSIPSHGALQSTTAQASVGGGIILAAAARERAAGGQRAGSAREAAGKRGGGVTANRQGAAASNRQVRSSATSNINHNRTTTTTNVNRNISGSVNRDVNVNIDRDVDVNVRRNYYDGWDDHWHPVASAAAVTATAVAIGSLVRTLPPSCSTVVVDGVSYSQCGGTWYLPQYSGTTVQYVVVNPPR
jgi:hypothetical protein